MKATLLLSSGSQRVLGAAKEFVYLQTGLDRTTPVAIRGILTERCNYRCQSCGCWRKDDHGIELTPEQWQGALASLRAFIGGYCIQFSGGEPFVYRGLLGILQWCAANGVRWGMITNGSAITADNARQLIAADPQNIDVSVDGATSAVHDLSRGVAGSLERIERSVVHLLAAKAAAGHHCAIRIKTTVHRGNIGQLMQIVDWAKRVGASSVDFSPVRPWTPEVESVLWPRPCDFDLLSRSVEQLVAAKRQGAPIETEEHRMRSWADHFRRLGVKPGLAPCRVGLRDYCMLPNGDVRMCWDYPVIGSVLHDEAREIWLGKTAQEQRRAMLTCEKFGTAACATSCLDHRTLSQDIKRVRILSRRPVVALPTDA